MKNIKTKLGIMAIGINILTALGVNVATQENKSTLSVETGSAEKTLDHESWVSTSGGSGGSGGSLPDSNDGGHYGYIGGSSSSNNEVEAIRTTKAGTTSKTYSLSSASGISESEVYYYAGMPTPTYTFDTLGSTGGVSGWGMELDQQQWDKFCANYPGNTHTVKSTNAGSDPLWVK